ncbi:putative DNA modification/repair radical SAM protein [Clostridium sp. YIM B02515]|uniref:DNA modification/repair radical SAM protein n=1 Tax=Clostridium rhizosphaerae TaxID=2803861 RepID=A0ABS1T9A3_9CLOT|nr:putative DNA modification/repair radical SAM protein [Clostridium rhizosphaerae]MBL4935846.1 putative DNA modification/repair radical SAM protein [Clostridium rhizosphaerae]
MDIHEKLKILSGAAKYDVSCSSSGSTRKNTPSGIGNASESGICHSFAADGRCISLLKILLTNYCVYDCVYCVNRSSNDVPRAAFTPEEVADLTINFYKRNYIEGLFLSSAVFKNANYTMELLLKTVTLLRNNYNFNGYIHIKAIPGADSTLIRKAGELVDRMSVNIELPSKESLKLLAPQKNSDLILKPMSYIDSQITANKEEKLLYKKVPSFVPAGQSTQLIIGATKDSDYKIMKLSENLYNNFNLKRVYYSAYVPVSNNPKLPSIINPPMLREHRLYQADWLLRFYGFSASELLNEKNPNLDINFDPKTDWAIKNIYQFPVEINSAPRKMLLRVPGVGVRSVQKIMAARKVHLLNFEDLKKLGIVLKRAQYFITCKGKYYGDIVFKEDFIKKRLSPKVDLNYIDNPRFEQITFFAKDSFTSITGEL